MDLLTIAAQVLQQMSILLKCCPSNASESSLLEWSPLPQSMLSPLALSSSVDDVVTGLALKLKVCLLFCYLVLTNLTIHSSNFLLFSKAESLRIIFS